MTGRHSGDGVKDGSHQLSDVNRQYTKTTTYEPPVNYQQLPSASLTAGRQQDYNVDNSSTVNKDPRYQELNVDTQPPVVYQQLAPR